MSNCPHGVPRPVSTYTAAGLRAERPLAKEPSAHFHAILDSRSCPECLQAQLSEANILIGRVFEIDRPGLDADTYALWIKYMEKYGP